jgi:hypothetical protein
MESMLEELDPPCCMKCAMLLPDGHVCEHDKGKSNACRSCRDGHDRCRQVCSVLLAFLSHS